MSLAFPRRHPPGRHAAAARLDLAARVLDLGSKQRTRLAEPGNVDPDAWLDEDTVAYAKGDETTGDPAVWSVPAHGSGSPTKLADDVESPAVLR